MAEILPIEASSLIPESKTARFVEAELDQVFPKRPVLRVLVNIANLNNLFLKTCRLSERGEEEACANNSVYARPSVGTEAGGVRCC